MMEPQPLWTIRELRWLVAERQGQRSMQAESNQVVTLFLAAQLSLWHPDKKYGNCGCATPVGTQPACL